MRANCVRRPPVQARCILLFSLVLGVLWLGCGKKLEPESVVALEQLEERRGLLFEKDRLEPFTGKAVVRFDSGELKKELPLLGGKLDGLVREWHENGQLIREASYKVGVLQGRTTIWHPNGEKHEEGEMVDGLRDGRWVRWDEEGREVLVAVMSKGQQISAELGASVRELVDQREAELAELDRTVWSGELRAQEYERTFIKLWDDLRAEKEDKWKPLETFVFKSVALGQPGEVTKHDWGIAAKAYTAGGQALAPAQWRELFKDVRSRKIELVETEWHHQRFEANGTAGMPWSEFSFVIHAAQREPERRYMVRGKLGVHWSGDKDTQGRHVPGAIEVLKARVWTRDGPPAFRVWNRLNPFNDNPQLRRGAVYAEPVLVHDLDGDGQSEILLVGANLVYRHGGNGEYRADILSPHATRSVNGAVLADFTGDGLIDLLTFPGRGMPELFAGDAAGRFNTKARRTELDSPAQVVYACTAGDVDGDGDLDVFASQYRTPYKQGQFPTPYYDANDGWPAYLLINDGRGNFTDGTVAAGLSAKRYRRTYSASLVDMTADGHLDLVVVNDFAGLDYYTNDGRGKFTDVSDQMGDERLSFGMSHALADFNRDGRLDLFMVGMGSTTARRLEHMGARRPGFEAHHANRIKLGYGNRMLLGTEDGGLKQATFNDQVARTGWSWGSTALDFDNDGDRDLFVANGHISRNTCEDYCTFFWRRDIFTETQKGKQDLATAQLLVDSQKRITDGMSWNGFEHNALLMNEEGKGFVNVAFLLGVSQEFDSRAVLHEDLDGDGRPEVLVVQQSTVENDGVDQVLHIFKNELRTGNHWIGARLRGGPGRSAQGAVVTVRHSGGAESLPVISGDSYTAQHSRTKLFGLGKMNRVESLEVRWPDGTRTTLQNPAVDQYHEVRPR